ncbi:hypothetical protein AAZX31_08G109700 [Glycine max]
MSLVISESEYPTKAGREGSLLLGECGNACEYRCSETHHRKPCLFFCNKCCKTSLCVPSGTYGHKEECPCYITIGIPRKENPSSLN